eukprot:CAMPEP_0202893312 /NCGR_PEP_ID=MMETSP1392-20130828/2916_1 /ASSEMBLY_ACC=CAM_ASM_000868 /TAXON_ID=225041 /ORGANISM="Chlamydomonas chlamydogama, Strain SAG 11-48b" /LENGTH=217 /DNA_ID=CAMNT_0049577599 /DNA_START=146 /DNA_END=796 /DNA_ORIENTATION=-
MGAGASRNVAADQTGAAVTGLPAPYTREDCMFFTIIPTEDELRRKGEHLVLEVGRQGFRLLRPSTEDPLSLFPWGQIHSWAHGTNRFTFRYFDDGKKAILQHNLLMRDVDPLLQHIQHIIDEILQERKSSAISDESFEELLGRVRGSDPSMHLELVRTAAKMNFFTSEQGRSILELLATGFDKVEVATLLHGRLIDQNRFSLMLEALDCGEDRDNVW